MTDVDIDIGSLWFLIIVFILGTYLTSVIIASHGWLLLVPILITSALLSLFLIIIILWQARRIADTGSDLDIDSNQYTVEPEALEYQNQINLTHSQLHPECVICQENVQSTILSCGHSNLCHLCAQRMKKTRGSCPICQRRIQEIEEEYFTQREYVPSRDPERASQRSEP